MQPQARRRTRKQRTLSHDLVLLFRTATKIEIRRARAEGDAVELTVNADGRTLAFTSNHVTLLGGDLDELASRRCTRRSRYNGIRNPELLTIAELEARDLPLYWNEEWLRRQLYHLGSYAEIARVHGFRSATTIASYASRKFGISIQNDYRRRQAALLRDARTTRLTSQQLADKHGVGVATVYRWLAAHSRNTPGPSRASDRPRP